MNFWTGSGLDYGMFYSSGNNWMLQNSASSPGLVEGLGFVLAIFAVMAGVMFFVSKANKTPRLDG